MNINIDHLKTMQTSFDKPKKSERNCFDAMSLVQMSNDKISTKKSEMMEGGARSKLNIRKDSKLSRFRSCNRSNFSCYSAQLRTRKKS